MARIAVVLPSTGFAGAERQAWLAAMHLRAAGHSLAVFAMTGGAGLAARCSDAGIALHVLPRTESRWAVLDGLRRGRALASLRTWRPDALLPFCSAPNVLCGLWAADGGPPTAWNQRDEGLFPQHARAERRALDAATVRTANGPGAEDWLVRRGAAGIVRIANAVVPDQPRADRAAWRTRLAVGGTDVLVVMAATFSAAKDHRMLIDAWRVVETACSDAWLILPGADGGLLSRLRAHADGAGLRRIVWPGPVDDISGLLSACDVGVLCSRSEGCSNAMLEYRAAGLACLGCRIPGIETAAGGNAVLVAPGDAEGLGTALRQLITDGGLRRQWAGRSRNGLPGQEAISAWTPVVERLLDCP